MKRRNNDSDRSQTTPDVESGDGDGALPPVPAKRNSSSRVSFQTPPPAMLAVSRISSSNGNYPQEVSPADTFETNLTSPSTRSNDSGYYGALSPPQKVVIDHNINTSTDESNKRNGASYGDRNRTAATLFVGLSKPLMGVGLLLLLGAGGMAAWGWLFQIPGLENQVKALEEQVLRLNTEIDRLTGQVDRLETENDRYQDLNNELNQTVVDLQNVTDDLEDVTVDLNTTNQELANQVDELEEKNEAYVALNKELNNTVAELAAEVDYFKVALADLASQNVALSNMTTSLEILTEQLTNTSIDQNETLTTLQEFLQNLIQQNDRLEEINADLVTLVNFLNETSTGIGSSLEEITTFLSDQININQQLVLLGLESTYWQRVQMWDCDYRDVFRDQPFGGNYTIPIDKESQLPAVLDYIDQRVLSQICLDVDDFSNFVSAEYPNGIITSNQMIRAVVLYSDLALSYFFPEQEEQGVTLEEWAQSSFQCELLPRPFQWLPSQQQR
jgi:methyl-accepting chemotaxis protein